MKKFDYKALLPYVAAIVVFLIITLIYLAPLFEGKQLMQSDIMNFKGMSKEITDFREKTGEDPLWTNSMFGGMPAYQISVVYNGNLLGFLDKIFTLGLPHPAGIVFLYFLGFFFLLLVLRLNPWLALVGAVGFALSSYFFIILEAGHNSKAHAIGYMAPVIAGIILTIRKKYLWGGILTAVFLSLEIKANHPQITYYLLMTVVILGIFELIDALRNKWLKSFSVSIGVLTIAALFSVATNITSLWATWEYGKDTIRGKTDLTSDQHIRTSGLDKDYATQWSYGIGETMTLLIPNLYGGSSNEVLGPNSKIGAAMKANNIPDATVEQFTSTPVPFLYWGNVPFTSGPVYVGAIIFFLFVLGLFIVKGPMKWWLLTATVLSVMLAWGHNFMAFTDLFLDYLPGYNKFRAVSMTLVIAELAIPLLGMLALKEVFDGALDKKKLIRNLQFAGIITAGIALLFAIIPGSLLSFTGMNDASYQQQFPDWFMQAIREDRIRVVRNDAFRSLLFVLIGLALLWVYALGKLKKEYVFGALFLFILSDMFVVNKRYLNEDDFTTKTRVATPFAPSAADLQILTDTTNYRVLNLTVNTFRDASTSYFHKSIGGYHGAKLRRYQELIDYQISKNNMGVLNMLNTKYVIIEGPDKAPMAQLNPGALGNAWFVKGVKLVPDADAEIDALTGFNPADTAVVFIGFKELLQDADFSEDTTATIRLVSYQPNKLTYDYTVRKNKLAVFSEIYYAKGWNAYLDGKAVPHLRADYVLRAMVLPAGSHKVEFRFEPVIIKTGETISYASSAALIILIIAAAGISIWKFMKSE